MAELSILWINTITYSSLIAILSIGFTLTYLTAKIPNFAHGSYAGIGIYVSWTVSKIFNISPYYGFPLSFVIGGLVSVLLYVLVINVITRLGGGDVVLTISTLAIQILLTALLNIYVYWMRDMYGTYGMGFMLKEYDFQLGGYPGIFIVSLFTCIGAVIVLHILLTRTRTGIAMRATAEDPELASVLGINIENIQKMSWFLTGGLACLAGSMYPLWFQSYPTSGSGVITSIMAGSLLGGFNNIYGAIIGGFGVGFSEIMVTTWMQSAIDPGLGRWRPLVPMIILVAVLLLEPRGLAGVYDRIMKGPIGDRLMSLRNKEAKA
ncbi:branched-chain amino acid ABC transporter permease [Candidatus Bathyarchaeota archaeon]|nr:branched-chain amino acid ABC transporter permease [Candidatus Bathyarchaeota archaeon]